ncbi:MAG: YwaF family protein [Planctomycetota bacterium]|jgi:hypothetical integral membrane protein (TIGR02206 family)
MNAPSPEQLEFVQFGPAHLVAISGLLVASAGLSAMVRYSQSSKVKQGVCLGLAVFLLALELFNYVFTAAHNGLGYFLQYELPLHVCGIAVYLTAYMLIAKKQLVFEIVYFWALGGTTQAIVTPALTAGFPSYRFFQFFVAHAAVIVGVCIAVFGLKMRPRLKGLWCTYALTWLLVFIVGGVNALLDTNYMYLCGSPEGITPFYFLPWPWYILFQGALALAVFYLLWLPFSMHSESTEGFSLSSDK